MIVGSFIIGLDVDQSGIGERIADMASHYGLDNLNALFLTPLPRYALVGSDEGGRPHRSQ